ncbi:MAG TPA: hypothetical protein VGP82_06730 [Ktedonobacterales bacterium]|nr:hypothetical protein [Ktedonobacterales bacterium]
MRVNQHAPLADFETVAGAYPIFRIASRKLDETGSGLSGKAGRATAHGQ